MKSNTAVTDNGVALAPVTVGGVTLPAGSTPTERFNAIVKANVQPNQMHVDGTVAEFTRRDGKAPPSPAELEAANKPQTPPADPLAAFDAEMRAKGLQRTDTQPTPAEQLESDVALVTAQYRTLMSARDSMPEDQRLRFKAAYENDVVRILNGTPLTPEQRAKMGRTGNVESFVPKTKDAAPKPAEPAGEPITPGSYQQHVKDGFVDIGKLSVADTSGYTIPRYVADQTIDVGVLDMLKAAKAAGITQDQVNAVMRADAVKLGWVKT